jgi:hypothetical protein
LLLAERSPLERWGSPVLGRGSTRRNLTIERRFREGSTITFGLVF